MDHRSLRGAMTISSVFLVCLVIVMNHLQIISGKLRPRYEQYDPLFVARCEAHCWSQQERKTCVKKCLSKNIEKPGMCPDNDSTTPSFASACLNACRQDIQCPNVTKCCRHSCGVTCQKPEGLSSVKGLPLIPKNIRLTERRKNRTLYLKWETGEHFVQDRNGRLLYLIEERHNFGKHFNRRKVTQWMPCGRTAKPNLLLRKFLKPGRWYQFRVAAVNGNGTRGYSKYSIPFSLAVAPRPPRAPQNITVGPLLLSKGSLSAEMRWSPPPSDLPVHKYRVFWSRRLHGATALDSVLVHQRVISKDKTSLYIHGLYPDSLYFLQIQAIAQFGKGELKSEKSGLVLNTTNYKNSDLLSVDNTQSPDRIEDLHLKRLFWTEDGDLHASIAWRAQTSAKGYLVKWSSGRCYQEDQNRVKSMAAQISLVPYIEIDDLRFNCRYKIHVRDMKSNSHTLSDTNQYTYTSITFKTPLCSDFKRNHASVKCDEISN